ncbi:relaxase/mobilization nuclease domain-containing protein [Oxalobacter sp. OttesenSCG-928-P03]|nr:relaxase/mobilization nuclease domain-containing protein [Oxalobacter sp. OttesenSCG-928-P03]
MPELIDNLLGEALTIRKKGNRTRNLVAVANRVSRGVPEVMVKVSGFGKGAGHVQSHLTYISRHGKVELETESGEILDGKDAVVEYFAEWQEKMEQGVRHKKQRDTMHLVLSMPAHVDEESVRRATRDFAAETFGKNHRYLFALHTDTSNPHCHITVLCQGRDGRRLDPKKADLQAWRETFAEKIREQGHEAEATSRRARGVVRKSIKAVIKHIESGDKTHKPRVSRVRALQMEDAAKELVHGKKQHSWEKHIEIRQKSIRMSWMAAATELEKQGTSESITSRQIRQMVDNMPPVKTEREVLIEELQLRFRRSPEKDRMAHFPAKEISSSQKKEQDRER